MTEYRTYSPKPNKNVMSNKNNSNKRNLMDRLKNTTG